MPDPSKMTLPEIETTMKEMMTLEDGMETSLLICRYYRGLLFIAANRHISGKEEFKRWLFDNFMIAYSTARRYISVTLLLKSFPMLGGS